jgi:chromosome segregation ATPase
VTAIIDDKDSINHCEIVGAYQNSLKAAEETLKENDLTISALESRIRELEAELKHCQESEGWSKMMAMEGKIEEIEAELGKSNSKINHLNDILETANSARKARNIQIKILEAELDARDNECRTEHYNALNKCIAEVARLTKLVQEHQTYQAKQGVK